jgi:hypothetical protein
MDSFSERHLLTRQHSPRAQIFLKVKARDQAADLTRRMELSNADPALRLPLKPAQCVDAASPARGCDEGSSAIWCVALEVLIPDAVPPDGPLLSVYSSAADDRRRAALTLSLRDSRVDVSLTAPADSIRIFRDPRTFHVGTWQRFRLAVRFGSARYGLAQLLHEEVLIANYTGPLG